MKDIVSTIYYVFATIALLAVVAKLFYGWFREDQTSKKFIIAMAEDHLPFIYRELRILNPGSSDHPHIAFIHFKDH